MLPKFSFDQMLQHGICTFSAFEQKNMKRYFTHIGIIDNTYTLREWGHLNKMYFAQRKPYEM